MPIVTKIAEQQKRPNRRNIHVDGQFSFACTVNVVAKYRLREGRSLTIEQISAIRDAEVKQQYLDAALRMLERRLHSRAELARKLKQQDCPTDIVASVLADLERMEYVDDARFAKTRAQSAMEYRKHGRRRAFMELMKSGVKSDVAEAALNEVYSATDSTAIARALAMKQQARLKRLDPLVARRRLVGMLQRRGFDYESIRPVIDEVLGNSSADE